MDHDPILAIYLMNAAVFGYALIGFCYFITQVDGRKDKPDE